MINARESLNLLLSSDKLDTLLVAARTKSAALDKKAGRTSTTTQVSELEQRITDAKKLGAKAVGEIRDVLNAKIASRTEKVAIVRHLLHFGSKIQPAA